MQAAGIVRLALIGVALTGMLASIGAHTPSLAAGPDGQAIYAAKCASCHKADGKGGGPFPGLAGNADMNAKDATAGTKIVVKGKGLMPAYTGKLSNAEIAAVMTYVRTSWGNKGTAVTEDDVAAIK